MSTLTAVLLAFTLVLSGFSTAMLASLAGTKAVGDAAMGQGLAWVYTVILLGLCWCLMAAMLLKAGGDGLLPGWCGIAAGVLWPVSAVSVLIAVYLLNDPSYRWPVVIPALIPWLVGGFVWAASRPGLKPGMMSLAGGGGVIWGLVALLSLSALPAWVWKLDEPGRKEIARQAELADPVKKAERRARSLALLSKVTPETPLEEVEPLLHPEGEAQPEAIAAVRQLTRRQEEVERWIRDRPVLIGLLPKLDVQATSVLCSQMESHLWNVVFALQLRGERRGGIYPSDYNEDLAIGVHWLNANGCDLSRSIAHFQEKVKESFPASPEREKFLAWIATLAK